VSLQKLDCTSIYSILSLFEKIKYGTVDIWDKSILLIICGLFSGAASKVIQCVADWKGLWRKQP
jgi:hypothetical protein